MKGWSSPKPSRRYSAGRRRCRRTCRASPCRALVEQLPVSQAGDGRAEPLTAGAPAPPIEARCGTPGGARCGGGADQGAVGGRGRRPSAARRGIAGLGGVRGHASSSEQLVVALVVEPGHRLLAGLRRRRGRVRKSQSFPVEPDAGKWRAACRGSVTVPSAPAARAARGAARRRRAARRVRGRPERDQVRAARLLAPAVTQPGAEPRGRSSATRRAQRRRGRSRRRAGEQPLGGGRSRARRASVPLAAPAG